MAEAHDRSRNRGVIAPTENDTKEISQAQRTAVAGTTKDNNYYTAEDFERMNLRPEVLQSLKARAYTKPMPLQQRAVVPLTSGYDVVIQACSGSGKKTIVSLTVLQIIDVSSNACQALVLTPTTSAAERMKQSISDMGECMNIRCHVCTGERRLKEDIHILGEGVHVVIGTLERICDLVNRNALKKREIKLLVIEEAGEMFSCASRNAICDMIKTLSTTIQLLFLNTLVEEHNLNEFRNILRYPVFLATQNEVRILENTEHFYIPVLKKHSKLEILLTLYKRFVITRALIFFQTTKEANMVANNLKTRKLEVTLLSDKLCHQERCRILGEFHTYDVHTLIICGTHDFIDLPQASVIINYDFPSTFLEYKFRTSRKDGTNHNLTIISFITENEQQMLPSIEKFCQVKINETHFFTENLGHLEANCLQAPIRNSFVVQSFNELNLRNELVEGMREYGLQIPTPLQRNAIFPCINGYDVIIHGHPRASKTTTLAVAILQNVDDNLQCCQTLVLTSTREKAQYMHEFLRELGRYLKVKCNVFYGGNSVRADLPILEKFSHIVVGTAGRIMDLIDRKALRTDRIKMLVLQEASSLFAEMQREQTYKIFQALKADVQIISSSTIPRNDALTQFKQFSKGSFCVVTYTNDISACKFKQFYLPLQRGDLIYETVSNIYTKLTIPQSVIFCNKSQNTNNIHQKDLAESNFLDNIRSEEKEIIKENFCSVCSHTLLSTSLLSRRKQNPVSVIVNYDFLIQKENYIYDASTSYYHKAIVADIAHKKEMIKIHHLEDSLVL